jgi:acyl-CoA synthetase (AMP-forming)/AMP-acid ligase II
MMKISRRAEEQLVVSYQRYCGLSSSSRLLVQLDFAVASMYARATACLRLGAICIFERRFTTFRAIVEHQPTHVKLFQYQLPELLDEFEAAAFKPRGLTALIGAAPLGDRLRARVLSILADELVYTYNSNESGCMAVIGAEGVATLCPGVNVKLIDESGSEVARGETGRICVRSPGLADGYMMNDRANEQMFREGWFMSGDAATAVGPRQIRLVGRSDDLLNIGGIKSAPSSIEEYIAEVAGVRDVAVTGVEGKDDVQEIGVAIVLHADADFRKTEEAILDRLARRYGRARVIAVQSIPRTEDSGKIQRNRLRDLFERTSDSQHVRSERA